MVAPPRLKSVLVCPDSLARDSSAVPRCPVPLAHASFKDVLLGFAEMPASSSSRPAQAVLKQDGEALYFDDGDQGLVAAHAACSGCAHDSPPCLIEEGWQQVSHKKKHHAQVRVVVQSLVRPDRVPTDLIGLYFNCFIVDHVAHRCPNPPSCFRCREPGHQAHECTDRICFHVRPVVVLCLTAALVAGHSQMATPVAALRRSRVRQMCRRRFCAACLLLPPAPPHAALAHQTSVPHLRTPCRHLPLRLWSPHLPLRLWSPQIGGPFQQTPLSGVLRPQSASSTVQRRSPVKGKLLTLPFLHWWEGHDRSFRWPRSSDG
jgi:hypothetical protein